MLEMHGWENKFSAFIELAHEGKWEEMGDHVTEEMLDEYTVVGTPEEVLRKLTARFGGVTQRVQLDDEWIEDMSDDDVCELVIEQVLRESEFFLQDRIRHCTEPMSRHRVCGNPHGSHRGGDGVVTHGSSVVP